MLSKPGDLLFFSFLTAFRTSSHKTKGSMFVSRLRSVVLGFQLCRIMYCTSIVILDSESRFCRSFSSYHLHKSEHFSSKICAHSASSVGVSIHTRFALRQAELTFLHSSWHRSLVKAIFLTILLSSTNSQYLSSIQGFRGTFMSGHSSAAIALSELAIQVQLWFFFSILSFTATEKQMLLNRTVTMSVWASYVVFFMHKLKFLRNCVRKITSL